MTVLSYILRPHRENLFLASYITTLKISGILQCNILVQSGIKCGVCLQRKNAIFLLIARNLDFCGKKWFAIKGPCFTHKVFALLTRPSMYSQDP